jgi:hypothetical protein
MDQELPQYPRASEIDCRTAFVISEASDSVKNKIPCPACLSSAILGVRLTGYEHDEQLKQLLPDQLS